MRKRRTFPLPQEINVWAVPESHGFSKIQAGFLWKGQFFIRLGPNPFMMVIIDFLKSFVIQVNFCFYSTVLFSFSLHWQWPRKKQSNNEHLQTKLKKEKETNRPKGTTKWTNKVGNALGLARSCLCYSPLIIRHKGQCELAWSFPLLLLHCRHFCIFGINCIHICSDGVIT